MKTGEIMFYSVVSLFVVVLAFAMANAFAILFLLLCAAPMLFLPDFSIFESLRWFTLYAGHHIGVLSGVSMSVGIALTIGGASGQLHNSCRFFWYSATKVILVSVLCLSLWVISPTVVISVLFGLGVLFFLTGLMFDSLSLCLESAVLCSIAWACVFTIV